MIMNSRGRLCAKDTGLRVNLTDAETMTFVLY